MDKLTKQQLSMVEETIEMAKKSDLLFRVGTVLFNSGIKVIGGCNKEGDTIYDPFGLPHNVCAIHAEMCVCMEYYQRFKKEIKSLRNIRKLVLCVVRYNHNGTIRNAKPCMECTNYLKKWFPCKIIYSTDEGFVFSKISNLESDHLSFMQRKRRHSPNGRL